jgi:hypothetical protein
MRTQRTINRGQRMRYFIEWGKAKKVLMRTMSAKDAEAQRHAIHVKVLGRDKSSYDLTNDDLDKLLGAFLAISNSAGFTEQVEKADQPAKRGRFKVTELMAALGMDDLGLQRMITARHEAGKLVTVQSAAAASFEILGPDDLERLALDLVGKCRKRWATKGDLLTEVRVLRMTADLDEETARETVEEAFGRKVKDFNKLDYEQLLKVVGAMRRMTTAQKIDGDHIPF